MSVTMLSREERLELLRQDLIDLSSPDAALCMSEDERRQELNYTQAAIELLEQEHAE
jgi:hypothetical protein